VRIPAARGVRFCEPDVVHTFPGSAGGASKKIDWEEEIVRADAVSLDILDRVDDVTA